MSGRKAVIVGGGFGGLAAALTLRQADIEPVVIERRADQTATSHGSGGGLTLWSNAIAALATIGLADEVIAGGTVLNRFDNRTSGGRSLARWHVDKMSERIGWPNVNIEWEVLHRILSEAVGADSVRRATSTGFRAEADTVSALLDDGTEATADLLVGADGLRSSIRTELFGEIAPRYAGYDVLRAVVPFEHPEVPSGLFVQVWGVGSRFGYYRVGGGKTYWFAVVNAQQDPAQLRQRHRPFLQDRMSGWETPVSELIEATPEAEISRIHVFDRDPITAWGSGRVTLLGDAAHPMTFNVGQGACQAIGDAVEMGRSLLGSTDTPSTLRRYEAARVARTSALVRRARRIGEMARWESPTKCAIRNTVLAVVLSGPGRRQHEQVITAS